MARLSRRQLRNLFLGASLSKSTATGAGEVSPLIGAIEAMQLQQRRQQEQRRREQEQKAQQSQQASLLPFQQGSGMAPLKTTDSEGKSLGGFLSNLFGQRGLLGAFTHLPQGVYETGKSWVHDIEHGQTIGSVAGLPFPNVFSGKSEVNKNVIKPVGESYSHFYGPLLPGGKDTLNFGKFFNRVYEAPFQPLLDIAAIPSLGATGAVKAAGLARSLGARGPVSESIARLGSIEGRSPAILPKVDEPGVEAPVLERNYAPSMNRRLFQRFIGDPLSQSLADRFPRWENFAGQRALRSMLRKSQGLKSISEQRAVEGSLKDIIPTLQQGNMADRLVGTNMGLSEEEQIALALRKRGITPQPLSTADKARGILELKNTHPEDYARALADAADVDIEGLNYLNRMKAGKEAAGGTLSRVQAARLEEAQGALRDAEARLEENARAPDSLLGRAQAVWRAGMEGQNTPGGNFTDPVGAGVPRQYTESLINLKPEVEELINHPTPAMLEASRAWDAAVEAQRTELGITPEEHRSRVWATQSLLRGGRPAAELEKEFQQWAAAQGGDTIAPNYIPDIPATNLEVTKKGELQNRQSVRTRSPAARAAVERAFVPPRFAYMEDTDLNAFKAGVFRTDSGVLVTHLAKVARDINTNFFNAQEMMRIGARDPETGDLLLIPKDKLDQVMNQSPDARQWEWVPQDVPVKWYNQEVNVLERAIEVMEENKGTLADDGLLEQLNALMETDARQFVQEMLGATKTDGFVVPKEYYDYKMKLQDLEDWRPKGAIGAYTKFLNKWRTLTLIYMPRWWVNTAVGSFVLTTLKGVMDPRAYYQAYRLMSSGKVPPGVALAGGFRHELQASGTGRELFPTRAIGKSVQTIEDFFRTASFLHSLDRLEKQAMREMGDSMKNFARPMAKGIADDEYVDYLLSNPRYTEAAMDEVNRFAYNFMELGPAERMYVRNAIPFWGWYKFITKLVWSLPFDYPGRTLVIQKLGQVGAESEQDLGPFLPVWMKGAILWNKQDPKNIRYMSTFGINPFSEFGNPFADEGFLPGILRAAQFAPPIQAAFASSGIDPLSGGETATSPMLGVGHDFLGRSWQGNKELQSVGAAGGVGRFFGSLFRSFPQVRTAELFNTGGRPVFPESVPQPPGFLADFFPGHEYPMPVREETRRTPSGLALQQFGLNIRSKNLADSAALDKKAAEYAATQAENDLKEYMRFLRKTYGR